MGGDILEETSREFKRAGAQRAGCRRVENAVTFHGTGYPMHKLQN